MKKNLSIICLFSLVAPLLFACSTNEGSSIITSEENSLSLDSSTSGDFTSASEFDCGGLDGYQHETIENEADYWYNTGVILSIGVNYRGSNLLERLRRGDIIYEGTGGFGITGHVAIVEGIYFSMEYDQYFVRLIEAISVGVARSILTPTRIIDKQGSAYRLKDADETEIDAAMDFIIGQLGKPYSIELAKSYSSENANWYCSEIIWAAYYHQGYNLDDEDLNTSVTPREIIQSPLVAGVSLS